jgi:hypothetical protein
MKAVVFFLVVLALVVLPAAAEDINATNTTPVYPVVLSFIGGQAFGDNPVQIVSNSTSEIAFIGNTSSRNISLSPDGGYVLRVDRAGLTDAANNPDFAFASLMNFVGEHPIGCIALVTIVSAIISAIVRRRKHA